MIYFGYDAQQDRICFETYYTFYFLFLESQRGKYTTDSLYVKEERRIFSLDFSICSRAYEIYGEADNDDYKVIGGNEDVLFQIRTFRIKRFEVKATATL